MERFSLRTPKGMALAAGVVLALVAIIFHFTGMGAATNLPFWLMTLAFVLAARW
jgi:hypothetical protein